MTVVQLTTDNRENSREYHKTAPWFGAAPEALLQGFSGLRDVQVHVVSCVQQGMPFPEKLAGNISFHSLHVPKLGWLRSGYQGCIRAVRRKLHDLRPDIVHGQGTERDCAISATLSGYPNVVTIHGNMKGLAGLFRAKPFSYHWLAARLETFTLRRTCGVFCNSAYTQELVAPRTRRTWLVPNAIRAQFFETPSNAELEAKGVILNVGVISPRKRQVEILELAMRLRAQGLKFQLEFIGACDPNTHYGRLFTEKISSCGEFARYLGLLNSDELLKRFDRASGLLHFPVEEAFGLVIPEALARGLKVFAVKTGGIIDIATDVPGAELFSAQDWQGLEQAIMRWVHNGHARPGGAADIMRQRYHPVVIARRHLEIYKEVLSRIS